MSITEAISLFQTQANNWNRTTFGNIFYRKKKILDRLVGIQKCSNYPSSYFLQNLEKSLTRDFSNILRQEQELWRLDSRINWLSKRDANTNFSTLTPSIEG